MGNVFLGFQGAATDVWRQDDIGQSASTEVKASWLLLKLFKHVHPTTPDLPVKDFSLSACTSTTCPRLRLMRMAPFHQSKFLHADQVLVGSPAIHMQ